ncbi:glycosyltransferase family 25 protein [Aurantiacibacter flavus]|uniref:Glycosyltransferase family 25 protein n=1 Tax=Aurantiacibacter flavus TaxID=3145232 RepID=A0ABV0CX08_9SPHN
MGEHDEESYCVNEQTTSTKSMAKLEPKLITRVISFADAIERRQRFTAMMEPFGDIDWAFHDVVPAEALPVSYDDRIAFQTGGSVLSPAERSCAASHLTVMREFLDGSADYLMAVEDDVLFDPTAKFAAHVKFMQLCNLDFYKLYARFFVPSRFIANIGRLAFYRAQWPTLGTQCYVVSRAGARILLDNAAANGGLTKPIDDTNDSYWSTGLPIVFPYPFPLMEIAYPSSIHAGRSLIHQRNAELVREMRRPTRLDKLKLSLRRRTADRGLRGFDKELARSIARNYHELHATFHG